jgi:CRISPR-associated protein (TIGR03986 family)
MLNKNRAGRAPYNFVPLPNEPKIVTAEPPGHHEWSSGANFSGEIRLEWEALTDFYFRGIGGKAAEPFQIDGKLRIPGSSIRGMARTMVEILTCSMVDRDLVNDDLLYFRGVGSTPTPGESSFEPHSFAYREQLGRDLCNVQAGYLRVDEKTRQWSIQPADKIRDGGKDHRWARYWTEATWERKRVRFSIGAQLANSEDHEGQILQPGQPGGYDGWLVCSGKAPPDRRKSSDARRQWLIPGPDAKAEPIALRDEDVDAYQSHGLTKMIETNRFAYGSETKSPTPCFFIQEKLEDGTPGRVIFGHTPNMRIPYRNSVLDRAGKWLTEENEQRWDYARAMFGFAGRKADASRRTRVEFEDAFLKSGGEIGDVTTVLLGSPRPTLYQHYVEQTSQDITKGMTWDGDFQGKDVDNVRPAGYKLYWHRPGATVPKSDQPRLATKVRPVRKGAKFESVIRFRNLSDVELGALLVALDLPAGHAHHIGGGKPLGWGSFRIDIKQLTFFDPAKRYGRFFRTAQAIEEGRVPLLAEALKNSAKRSLTRRPAEAFWADPRHAEFLAMLNFDAAQQLGATWHNRTRYLEFGRAEVSGLRLNYNEYTQVMVNNRALAQKRRPLPKPTEVLTGQGVPDDPRPAFVPRRPE